MSCAIFIKRHSGPLLIDPDISCSILPEKKPWFFFHWKDCLFFKNLCFQQPLRCCRNDLTTCTMIVRVPCWPPEETSWGFSYSIKWEKAIKFFLHWKCCLFFKNLCFQQPLRCYRNELITSTVIVKTPFGLLKNVLWGLPHQTNREKMGQNFFFKGNFAFIFKILCFH